MVLTFFVVIVVTLVALRFTFWADRQRIEQHIVEQGGKVLSIERDYPVGRMLISERNTTFWRVRYLAHDGSIRIAECFASFLRCKTYREATEGSSPEPARNRLEILPGIGLVRSGTV